MLSICTQTAIAVLHDIASGNDLQSANFLFSEEEWKEDCLNNILGIIYNGQEEKIRINQIYNILYVKVNDWIVYINNKYTDHE